MTAAHIVASLLGVVCTSQAAHASGLKFQSFLSIAGAPAYSAVYPAAINNAGKIVGSFTDDSPSAQPSRGAFVFARNKVTVVSVPGALETDLASVNNSGIAVGTAFSEYFSVDISVVNGTLLPLALKSGGPFVVTAVNDKSQLVGRTRAGGVLFHYDDYATATRARPLAVPGAISTNPVAINNTGQVVGTYYDSAGTHGFLYTGGLYAKFDVPGAANTFPAAINNHGEIVGSYGDVQQPADHHGFIEKDGVFTTIEYPGTLAETVLTGVNDHGAVVGWYYPPYNGEAQPQVAGFVASPQP